MVMVQLSLLIQLLNQEIRVKPFNVTNRFSELVLISEIKFQNLILNKKIIKKLKTE